MEQILKQYQERELRSANIEDEGESSSAYNIFAKAIKKPQQIQQKVANIESSIQLVKNKQAQNALKPQLGLDKYLIQGMTKCKSKSERKQMKKMLIDHLKDLKKSENLNEIDFSQVPTPLLFREKQEQQKQSIQIIENSQPQETEENDEEDLQNLNEEYQSQLDVVKKQLQISEGVKNAVQYIKLQLFGSIQAASNCNGQSSLNTNNEEQLQEVVLKELEKDILGQKKEGGNQNKQQIQQKQGFQIKMVERFMPLDEQLEQYQKQQQSQDDDQSITKIIQSQKSSQKAMGYQLYTFQHEEEHQTQQSIVGISTLLEKQYLRIQGEAKPEEIRPINILQRSFKYVIQQYNQTGSYSYIQQQLRAIRQDLLVQRIRNEFTLEVFEENCRISLENQDKFEFIRTLHEIMTMYDQNIQGNQQEFTYYSLLLHIMQKDEQSYQALLRKLPKKLLISSPVEKALLYRQTLMSGNVYKFFQLYKYEKGYSKFIIDLFIEKVRKWGIKLICKTYGPTEVPVNFFIEFLSFQGFDNCYKFLLEINAKMLRQCVQVKETLQLLNSQQNQQNKQQ